MAISFPRTRVLQAATAAYGVYALTRPEHLGKALQDTAGGNGTRLAYTYAVRDLATSAMGVLGPARLVPLAAALRVIGDVGDAAILGSTTGGSVRAKGLGVTLGWATLNSLAYSRDVRARRGR